MNDASVEALSCQEVVELVTAYLEGALPAPDRVRFESHLATCDGCRRYLAQMETTIRLTGRVTPDDLSPEAERDLLSAFRSWRE
jgi:anti-sigma factor RsiW